MKKENIDYQPAQQKNERLIYSDVYASRHVLISNFSYCSSYSHIRTNKHSIPIRVSYDQL